MGIGMMSVDVLLADGMEMIGIKETQLDSLTARTVVQRWMVSNMTDLYFVLREKRNVTVSILRDKRDVKYLFINLIKGHICECGFDTIGEALQDMNHKIENGEIIDYFQLLGESK